MKVKICGLSRPEDIAAVNEAMPDYCGFILEFPRSRRNVPMMQLGDLLRLLRPEILPVGVFVDCRAEMVAGLARVYRLPVVQLHGHEANSEIDIIRENCSAQIWKAFQIRAEDTVQVANRSHADLVLFDAGQGGGVPFDWSLLEQATRPFALAGGLNAENIPQALRTKAVLLDISSGVETGGFKDAQKIKTIVSMIKGEG